MRPGQETSKEWIRPGLLLFRRNPPRKIPRTGQFQDLEENSGRERRWHRGAEEPTTGKNPRGPHLPGRRTREEKRGRRTEMGTAVDAGMRNRMQRQATEAGG